MKKAMLVAATFTATALLLSGCSAGSNAKSQGSTAQSLTIGLNSAPVSLDPTKSATGLDVNYVDPTYASLLDQAPDGQIVAGLADKWGYVGTDNKEFQLTLRKGLKFADGTALTAQDVVDSIEFFRKGSGPSANYYKGFTLTAPDTTTVVIRSANPNPAIPDLLTPSYLGGAIISPAGINSPSGLAANTFGAGPYVYDAAKSVTNDHYVFTPNKNYWDKGSVKFSSITIRVIPNITSALQALRSGQIDFMSGNADVAASAKGVANIVTKSQPSIWAGLFLLDRNGTVVPALKDVRVRQALNYAVDRAAITKAVYGSFGQPIDQPAVSGFDGYDASLQGAYPYNPSKAKQLLTEAGHASGLTIPVNYGSFDPDNTKMIQAVQAQLADVGVTLKLTADANFGGWVNDLVSKKFAATVLSPGSGGSAFFTASGNFMPGGIMNVFNTTDPDMVSAFDTLASASQAERGAAAQRTTQVAVEDALALPISASDAIVMYNSALKGVQFVNNTGVPTLDTSWSK